MVSAEEAASATASNFSIYLEGQAYLASRLITPITHIETPVVPIINPLTKPRFGAEGLGLRLRDLFRL